MLRVFTAFSGYDSQCMALDRLGIPYELVGWSEIDRFAVLAHNAVYPQWADRNFGDISKIDWNAVPDFDLFTYSFPCTDISAAGRQEGFAEGSGTRSSLLWECRKAVEAKRPRYLLMENVKALVSEKFLPLLMRWEQRLASLGYANFTKVLNARDYGVPQNRERVFMVSLLDGGAYHFPEPFPLERSLRDVLEDSVPERYYLSGEAVRRIFSVSLGSFRGAGVTDADGVARALTSGCSKTERRGTYIAAVRGRDTELPGVLAPKRTDYGKAVRKRYEAGELQESRRNLQRLEPRTDGVSNTITTVQKDNLVVEPGTVIGSAQKNAYVGSADGVSPCITAACGMGGGQIPMFAEGVSVNPLSRRLEFGGIGSIRTDWSPALRATDCKCPPVRWEWPRVRKLTPRECFRLMDVDEEDTGRIQAAGISASQQYRLAGNSIVVSCLYHIFRKLLVDTACESRQLAMF